MSTRSAKPQRQSQHATRRAERPSQKPGKENADPKVSNAVTSSRPSKVKRIVDSFSTDERDNKDAPDSDLVAANPTLNRTRVTCLLYTSPSPRD